MESWDRTALDQFAATRVCGALAGSLNATFEGDGPTIRCNRRPLFMRCISAGGPTSGRLQNRAHFFGVAARSCVAFSSHARRHGASKRGSGVRCVAIDEAKRRRCKRYPYSGVRSLRSMDWRRSTPSGQNRRTSAICGLTIDEAAQVLGVSPSTAKRDWRTAKAWLNRELGSGARA